MGASAFDVIKLEPIRPINLAPPATRNGVRRPREASKLGFDDFCDRGDRTRAPCPDAPYATVSIFRPVSRAWGYSRRRDADYISPGRYAKLSLPPRPSLGRGPSAHAT